MTSEKIIGYIITIFIALILASAFFEVISQINLLAALLFFIGASFIIIGTILSIFKR